MPGDRGYPNQRGNQTELNLAVIGHEVRNTLGGLEGLTELLLESGLKAEQRLWVEAVRQSVDRMSWLLEGLEPRGEKRPFPPPAVISRMHGIEFLEQLVRAHTPAAIQNHNSLLFRPDPDLPSWWTTDGRLLRLLLDNLLGNAIKYNNSENIFLDVRCEANDCGTPGTLFIDIRDSGPVIDSARQSSMFDPWVRLETDRLAVEGSGLGLYICQQIISQLRGTIGYQSSVERDNCFRVSLPGVVAPAPAIPSSRVSLLFQSVVCHVSLSDAFSASICPLLTRLGIGRVLDTEKTRGTGAKQDCNIHITDQPHGDGRDRNPGGLYVSFGASRGNHFRWLPPPHLESTLGPLLMEMVFEHRMSENADSHFSPVDCEAQGSIPGPR